MRLSIVTSVYNGAEHVEPFHARMTRAAQAVTDDYEMIVVNDGSQDDSLARLIELTRRDHRLSIIDLSRNFGHHRALMTGLRRARGERVFVLDSDLEEDPELLEAFWRDMEASPDVDVVYGVQRKRKGGVLERVTGWFFYVLFNAISERRIPRNICIVRLMSRRNVRALTRHREIHPVFAALAESTSFRQRPYVFDKQSKGTSQYTLRRKLALVLDSITSFSARPLTVIFHLGLLTMLGSAASTGIVLWRKLAHGIAIGWTSIVLSIWFFGGLTVFCMGVIGIYLSRVFEQTKKRPYTIVRRV